MLVYRFNSRNVRRSHQQTCTARCVEADAEAHSYRIQNRKDMNEEDIKVVEEMAKFGGSFVQHLAELCWHADANNLQRIKDTWPEYWKQYKDMAEGRSPS